MQAEGSYRYDFYIPAPLITAQNILKNGKLLTPQMNKKTNYYWSPDDCCNASYLLLDNYFTTEGVASWNIIL
jgi:hypothetical protein